MFHTPKQISRNLKSWGNYISATPENMVKVLGKPDFFSYEKNTMGWLKETDSADVFKIEFYSDNENSVEWNILTRSYFLSCNIKNLINNLLK